jgi:hypothetical protein
MTLKTKLKYWWWVFLSGYPKKQRLMILQKTLENYKHGCSHRPGSASKGLCLALVKAYNDLHISDRKCGYFPTRQIPELHLEKPEKKTNTAYWWKYDDEASRIVALENAIKRFGDKKVIKKKYSRAEIMSLSLYPALIASYETILFSLKMRKPLEYSAEALQVEKLEEIIARYKAALEKQLETGCLVIPETDSE